MIKIKPQNSYTSVVTQWKFPAGEIGVKLNQPVEDFASVEVIARIHNSDDLIALCMTIDAIRAENPRCRINLALPYVPYARQDRVCSEGEALSIRVLANLINSLECSGVLIVDPHSDVTPALIDNVFVCQAHGVFETCKDWSDEWIVAPDAGATKRCEAFAKAVGAKGVIQCIKKRDPATGKLSGFKCLDDVAGKKVTIVDDICDAGGTFLGLRSELAAASQVDLAVTHGIFTQGVAKVACVFNHVYTALTYHAEPIACVDNVTWIDLDL